MVTWGGSNGVWSLAANWIGGKAPTVGVGATIASGNPVVDTPGLAAASVALSGAGSGVAVNSGGSLAVAGAFTVDAASTLRVLDGGALSASRYEVAGNLAVSGTLTGAIVLGASGKVTFDVPGPPFAVAGPSIAYVNAISGSGTIEKLGESRVILGSASGSGNNAHTGSVVIANGILGTDFGNGIGDTAAVAVASAAFLSLGASETIGTLAGSGAISTREGVAATLTTGGNNVDTLFSGEIGGAINLTKAGTGKMTLSGTGSGSGTTTVDAGVLEIASTTALAESGRVVVNSQGTLRLAASATTGAFAGSGKIDLQLVPPSPFTRAGRSRLFPGSSPVAAASPATGPPA